MTRLLNSNSISGLFLVFLGAATAIYCVIRYEVGTLVRMGPGLYPATLGTLLTICGALILIGGFIREAPPIRIDFRALFLITGGIVAFSLLINYMGLVPATLVLVLMSNLAIGKAKPVHAAIVAISTAIATMLIFSFGLGIPLRAFRWPL
ncbi:tripartite tricarboxylate transporter TctB family protein [Aliihoeflea sp. PC F10.4]